MRYQCTTRVEPRLGDAATRNNFAYRSHPTYRTSLRPWRGQQGNVPSKRRGAVTRKAALAEADKLTMTELYNLREKLRSGAPMDEKEQRRATKARAAIVNRLHEQLDQAVADAYGWGDEWRSGKLGPSEIVARLVALNHERAAEEKAGKVRWLRPEYQEPRFGSGTSSRP